MKGIEADKVFIDEWSSSFGPAFSEILRVLDDPGSCECVYVNIDETHRKKTAVPPDCPTCTNTGLAMAVEKALINAGILPINGVLKVEYGRKASGTDVIFVVSDTEWGRKHATHTRKTMSWVAEGPNDNWPKYMGPWSPIAEATL